MSSVCLGRAGEGWPADRGWWRGSVRANGVGRSRSGLPRDGAMGIGPRNEPCGEGGVARERPADRGGQGVEEHAGGQDGARARGSRARRPPLTRVETQFPFALA